MCQLIQYYKRQYGGGLPYYGRVFPTECLPDLREALAKYRASTGFRVIVRIKEDSAHGTAPH